MNEIDPKQREGTDWSVEGGQLKTGAGSKQYQGGNEALTYNNPFGQPVERVWFDDKLVYAVDCGDVEVDPSTVKVAQEYQLVYGVDNKGEPTEEVEGQYNIYDSVPGMDKYSPLWVFNYVVVPRDYKPNTIRSEQEVRKSGYRVVKSKKVEN